MQTVQDVFARYEELRDRLPSNQTRADTVAIRSLLDLKDQADAFVFDAFGVLNVGTRPIPGAAARLDELRAAGCAIRILSNAASYDNSRAIEKFHALGLRVEPTEIITSRDIALEIIDDRVWGVIAAEDDTLTEITAPTLRLDMDASAYDHAEGFLFLSTAHWNPAKQSMLIAALQQAPRPVIIANADLVAPRGCGLSLEPGYFGHQLVDLGQKSVRFCGKPYPDVYDLARHSLPDIPARRIVMCGDTLQTDILGAAAVGWKTVLVTRDGVMAGHDAKPFIKSSGLHPNWILDRI